MRQEDQSDTWTSAPARPTVGVRAIATRLAGGRWVLPAACGLTLLAWLLLFPPKPINVGDVIIETTVFIASAAGFLYVRRLGVALLTLGWGLFVVANASNLCDEFLRAPSLVNTMLEGAVEATGLSLAVVGLYRSYRRRMSEMEGQRRLEGAIVTARMVAHELNNRLVIVRGYGELLPTIPAAEVPLAAARIQAAADGAAETLSRLQHLVRFAEMPTPVGPMLDLEASTSSPAVSSPHAAPSGAR